MERSLKELRPSDYNPRVITTTQKDALKGSYQRFGDLSGIIFNRKTKNLVGGHQRTELYRKTPGVKVEYKDFKDATGTVALGYVLVPLKNGGTMRIPYREVLWDAPTEMAANIAANAGGGSFEYIGLGKVIKKLQKSKFEMEDIPLDMLEMRRALAVFDSIERDKSAFKSNTGAQESFDAAVAAAPTGMIACECPKCRYKWSEPIPGQPEPKRDARVEKAIVVKKRNLHALARESQKNERKSKPAARKVALRSKS